MLITMLADRFDANGVLRARGTQVDVPNDLALRWIGDGVATPVGNARDTAQGVRKDVVVTQDLISGQQFAGQAAVSGAGNALAGRLDGGALGRLIRRSAESISIPSPYSPSTVVHPSREYVEGGWCGYPYWMAFTPYPNNDSAFENPSIACSIDGVAWIVPPGVTNPVVAVPAINGNYNSDTHLRINPLDPAQMILLWRERAPTGGRNRLYIRTSSDGFRTMSAPVQIWEGVLGTSDMASPSLNWNPATNKWEIVAHNADAANFPLRKITSTQLLSGWDTAPVSLTFPALAGRGWWHSEFRVQADGSYIGLAQDNNNVTGNAGNIYAVFSQDGSTFAAKPLDLLGTWYRPTFTVERSKADRAPIVVAIYSELLSTSQQLVTYNVAQQADTAYANAGRAALAQAIGGYGGALLADNTTRADSTTSPGAPNVGAAWVNDTAGIVGILTNRLYNVTSANSRILTDLGVTDYAFEFEVQAVGAQAWMITRAVDVSNYWRFGFNTATTWRLQTIVAGATGAIDRAMGPAPTAGDRVRMEWTRDRLLITINGVRVFETNSTVHAAGTKAGMQLSGATPTYIRNVAGWAT